MGRFMMNNLSLSLFIFFFFILWIYIFNQHFVNKVKHFLTLNLNVFFECKNYISCVSLLHVCLGLYGKIMLHVHYLLFTFLCIFSH